MHSPAHPPRVLVLLAAFNGMEYLPAQMASILGQQAVAVQVVLSIDRSSDGTEAWVAQLAQQDARVSVLPGGQVFGGAAPNFFRLLSDVDMAGYDYVALADQDDLWHPDKLAGPTSNSSTRALRATRATSSHSGRAAKSALSTSPSRSSLGIFCLKAQGQAAPLY